MAELASPQTNMNDEISEWKEIRGKMHEAIEKRDRIQVLECLRTSPHLKLWLDTEKKQSAMCKALQKKAFDIYGLLQSCECDFKSAKEQKKCFKRLTRLERSAIQRERLFVTKYKNSDIHYLISRTESQTKTEDLTTKVVHVFEKLGSVELLRPILQVAATAHYLRIRFDFKRDNVQCMMGCAESAIHGVMMYEKEDIFIGAKAEYSAHAVPDPQLLGTLAHELCHLAIHLVYRNCGKPYFRHDEERKRTYQDIIRGIENKKAKLDEIIRLALNYDTEEELIVRVPHILALYGSRRGYDILNDSTPDLLNFYTRFVIPDMIAYAEKTHPRKDGENIRAQNARLGKAEKTEELHVKFVEPLDLNTYVANVALRILSASELFLLEIAVHDAVKLTGQSYLFFQSSQWDNRLQYVLYDNKCDVVLLTCDDNEKCNIALNVLSEISKVVGTKVVLLVSERDKDRCVAETERIPFFTNNFRVSDIPKALFDKVSPECMNEIRTQSLVRFQGRGHEVPIDDIMDSETFKKFVDLTTFTKLCESGFIEIGSPVYKVERDVSSYYVERQLQRSVEVDIQKIRLDCEGETFAFSGCSQQVISSFFPSGIKVHKWSEHLKQPEKFVLLENIDEYELIIKARNFEKNTVHLLQYDKSKNVYVWVRSNGPLSHLPWTKTVSPLEQHQEEYLVQTSDKVVVVCGEPGMGKSALACHISREVENTRKKSWVLYIDLAQDILSVESKSNAKDIQQLALLCGLKKAGQEFAWFEHSVVDGIPFEVVLIFDGFDEIDGEDRQYVLKLVQHLSLTKVSKILLFGRTVFKISIQDALYTVPLELLPFSNNQLALFLKRYWTVNGAADFSDKKLDTIATQAINKYMKIMGNSQTPLDNPVLIRMIAELDQHSLLDDVQDAYRYRTIFDIYKRFADCKYELYCMEKKKQNIKNDTPAALYDYKRGKEASQRELGLLATNVIFDKKWQEKILTSHELKDIAPKGTLISGVKKGRIGHGLVDGVRNGRPSFIHRTFAEFFVAKLIFHKVEEVESDAHDMATFVVGMYEDENYERVTQFLDSFAAEYSPVHSAIINANVSSRDDTSHITRHVTDEDISNRDKFRRTPLHVAALHAKPGLLRSLPMTDGLRQIDIFGMTPLMYADKVRAWNRMDVFCYRCTNSNVEWNEEIPTAVKNIKEEKDLRKSVLFEAVKGSLCSLLDVLLGHFCTKRTECHLEINPDRVDVDTIKDILKRTLLFYAGSKDVLKLFLPYCDIRATDREGVTVLHDAVIEASLAGLNCTWRYTFEGMTIIEVVELRLLHFPYGLLDDPLFTSIRSKERALVILLLLRSPNIIDTSGCTALEYALKYFNSDIVNLLLLHSSVRCSKDESLPVARLSLADYGGLGTPSRLPRSPPSQCDTWIYEEVFQLQRYRNQLSEMYVSLCYSPEKLCQIVSNAKEGDTYYEAFQAFFPYWSFGDRNIMDTDFPYIGILRDLLSRRANSRAHTASVQAVERILRFLAPLTPAFLKKQGPSLLKHLLLHFEPSSTDERGYTALHYCCAHGLLDGIRLLVPHSNITAKDEEGRIALQVVSELHGEQHEATQVLRRWTMNEENRSPVE